MICWRIDISKKLLHYLDGELAPSIGNKVEAHLLDCSNCRAKLAQLRTGQRFIKKLPRLAPTRNGWDAIEAAISTESSAPTTTTINTTSTTTVRSTGSTRTANLRRWWQLHIVTPSVTGALAFTTLLLLTLLIITHHHLSPSSINTIESVAIESSTPAESMESLEVEGYQTVSISDIKNNTAPHIKAEGYVSEVRIDKDGDLTFRLVEDLQKPEPFIVCEIISPIKITPPPLGSRVRVYGVSRFDSEENHNWYEVHPVLNIELVSR